MTKYLGQRAGVAIAFAAVALLPGRPTQAQTTPPSVVAPTALPNTLQLLVDDQIASGRVSGASQGAKVASVVGFTAGGFRFNGVPPRRYEVIRGTGYYTKNCNAKALPIQYQPYSGLTGANRATLFIERTIPGVTIAAADPPTQAWADAAVQARADINPAPTLWKVTDPGVPTTLAAGRSILVLPVAAHYDLAGLGYQLTVSGASVGISVAGRVVGPVSAPAGPVSVQGNFSGGRWDVGAGMLFIMDPALDTDYCAALPQAGSNQTSNLPNGNSQARPPSVASVNAPTIPPGMHLLGSQGVFWTVGPDDVAAQFRLAPGQTVSLAPPRAYYVGDPATLLVPSSAWVPTVEP